MAPMTTRDPASLAIALRPVRPDDWQAIHAWAHRDDVCEYQSWGPNSPGETREFVSDVLAEAARRPRNRYTWCSVTPSGDVVGIVEVTVRSRRWRCAEVGYTVHPDHWRRGYATRMARLAVDFAFAELRMHRVEATCDPRNVGSARVLRNIGMTHEGRRRHSLEIRDGWRDSDLFGVLEDEWRPLTSARRPHAEG